MSKWISVDDELPNEIDDVLLYCKSRDEKFYSIIVGRRSIKMHPSVYGDCPWAIRMFATDDLYLCMEKDRIYNPDDQSQFFFGKVTHWMPLPELPK
jgi:hypothetical protein